MPPPEGRPLSGTEISALIVQVADKLTPEGPQHTLIIVGGSLLAWYGLRASTEDVDSIAYLNAELREAVASVAAEHDLDVEWLNAKAAQFKPQTFRLDECDVLFTHPRLRVFGASMRQVFIMKLARADAPDLVDMAKIWSSTGFTSSEEVVGAFYEAYPHEEVDPYLRALVIKVAERAGYKIT